MLKSILFRCLLCTMMLGTSVLTYANEINVSTDPDNWELDVNAKLTDLPGALIVKSITSNIWLSPKDSFVYQPGMTLTMNYQLRSGNVIIQANWFDAGGNYLEATKLGMDTSNNTNAQFSVVRPESAESATNYRIKIWLESELPSFELKSLTINEGAVISKYLFMAAADFEPADNLKVRVLKSGVVDLELRGNSSSGSVHSTNRYDIKSSEILSVALDQISFGTSFSMQLLYWDAVGTYLGHQDVLKDIVESTRFVTIDMSTAPQDVSAYSIKFWLSGYAGSSAEVRVMQGQP